MSAFHQLVLPALGGGELPLSQYADRLLLVVNVASHCGLTPQYAGLEQLYQRYAGRGLVVLGIPCNQFAGQEPGSDEEIRSFCSLNYGVSFPPSLKSMARNGTPFIACWPARARISRAISPGTSKNSSSTPTAACWGAFRRVRRRTIRH